MRPGGRTTGAARFVRSIVARRRPWAKPADCSSIRRRAQARPTSVGTMKRKRPPRSRGSSHLRIQPASSRTVRRRLRRERSLPGKTRAWSSASERTRRRASRRRIARSRGRVGPSVRATGVAGFLAGSRRTRTPGEGARVGVRPLSPGAASGRGRRDRTPGRKTVSDVVGREPAALIDPSDTGGKMLGGIATRVDSRRLLRAGPTTFRDRGTQGSST